MLARVQANLDQIEEIGDGVSVTTNTRFPNRIATTLDLLSDVASNNFGAADVQCAVTPIEPSFAALYPVEEEVEEEA